MTSMMILVAFTGFMFGGIGLMLMLGYRDIEEQRSDRKDQEALDLQMKRVLEEWPSFIVEAEGQPGSVNAVPVPERVMADLEEYLKGERDVAAQFVSDPSVDNLYRQAEPHLPVN